MPTEPKKPIVPTVATGVYLDHNRHTAIVVRVKNGIVTYLTLYTGSVTLHSASQNKFLHTFVISMPNYPIRKALATYWRSGLAVEDDAKQIIQIVARNLTAQRG